MWAEKCSECNDLVYPTTKSALKINNNVLSPLYFCQKQCFENFSEKYANKKFIPIKLISI